MSYLPFAITAYLFNSISALVDKYLITGTIKNPLVYVFYFSIFSLIALLVLPFTHLPSVNVLLLASTSTLLWTTGAYFMFWALKHGQVSRVIPVIGTLNPLLLLIFAWFNHSIGVNETWAIVILVLGLVVLTLPDWRGRIIKQELLFELLSSIFFATSYILLRQAYLQDNFLTVLAWSRLVLIPIGVLLVALPQTRQIVLGIRGSSLNLWSIKGLVFMGGQAAGGAAELLLTFSVSLANPALVNSLQGIQYVFLFGFSLVLGRKFPRIYSERLSPMSVAGKILGVMLIGVGLYFLALSTEGPKKLNLGVTFSPRYAKELGLEPEGVFKNMVELLQVRKVRLPVYWDEVESSAGHYDFSKVDRYIELAQTNNVELILGVGYKQPRWPECFPPSWTKGLSFAEQEGRLLDLVRAEVGHFKQFGVIKSWQVENESYLSFGLCQIQGPQAVELLNKEVALVRSLDSRPILLTDSGELTTWSQPMRQADWFGISLYRTVWNPYFGLVDYPLAPAMYQIKAQLAELLSGGQPQKLFISELQAEPWATTGKPLPETPLIDQMKVFPVERMTKNVEFARETGFDEIYLWGVEWWYYMDRQGRGEYLEQARRMFGS